MAESKINDIIKVSLEKIKDNYPKYLRTMDRLLQKRNGIIHANIVDFIAEGKLI